MGRLHGVLPYHGRGFVVVEKNRTEQKKRETEVLLFMPWMESFGRFVSDMVTRDRWAHGLPRDRTQEELDTYAERLRVSNTQSQRASLLAKSFGADEARVGALLEEFWALRLMPNGDRLLGKEDTRRWSAWDVGTLYCITRLSQATRIADLATGCQRCAPVMLLASRGFEPLVVKFTCAEEPPPPGDGKKLVVGQGKLEEHACASFRRMVTTFAGATDFDLVVVGSQFGWKRTRQLMESSWSALRKGGWLCVADVLRTTSFEAFGNEREFEIGMGGRAGHLGFYMKS